MGGSRRWSALVLSAGLVGCVQTPEQATLTFGAPADPTGVTSISAGETDSDGGDEPRDTGGVMTGGFDSGSFDDDDTGVDTGGVDGPNLDCTPGETATCYGGPANTENVGECQSGEQTCEADGTWGPCTGEVLPDTESCNGLDDDCNANVDDGNPGGGTACTTGLPGPCASGTLTCSAGALSCAPTYTAAASETCGDGVDNDCNGAIDDTCAVMCDPMNPAPACGVAQQCMPSPAGTTSCIPTPGAGVQYTNCLADTDCAPGHVCVNTGFGTTYCMQWCTSYLQCPYALDDCVGLSPAVYAGAQEYGVCYDGFP